MKFFTSKNKSPYIANGVPTPPHSTAGNDMVIIPTRTPAVVPPSPSKVVIHEDDPTANTKKRIRREAPNFSPENILNISKL